MNPLQRKIVKFTLTLVISIITFILYKVLIIHGSVLDLNTTAEDVVAGAIIWGIVSALVGNIRELDPNKELLDDLRKALDSTYDKSPSNCDKNDED